MWPVSLEILDLSGGDPKYGGTPHKFTGGIPAEWSSMTNLKELRLSNCGLDGESACADIPSQKEIEYRMHRARRTDTGRAPPLEVC